MHENNQNKKEITFEDFGRRFPRLSLSDYQKFHSTLKDLDHEDLSWRIERCGIDGMRLDCPDIPIHRKYTPIRCRRRICPQCAILSMADKVDKFRPLSELASLYETNCMEPHNWRIRFWTFTQQAVKGEDLTHRFKKMQKALWTFWRYAFGDRSQNFGGPYPAAGGLFCFEVQSGWNVHLHGLVLGPFYPPKLWDKIITLWFKCCEDQGTHSEHFFVEQLKKDDDGTYIEAILETVAYPLRPDKKGKFDQVLMANIEHAMLGTRRLILKGSWYNVFKKKSEKSICPECVDNETINYMYREKTYNDILGKAFSKLMFTESIEGLRNWATIGYRYPKADLQKIINMKAAEKIPGNENII